MKAIRFRPSLLAEIRALSKADRHQVGGCIAEAQQHIGQPHLHRGLGIRKLRDDYFELRITLALRLVFENTREALVFELFGDHAAVKRFLKSH